MTTRNNRIAKDKQYVSGNDTILPAWLRQSLFIASNITKLTGPRSVKRHDVHAFAHNKAPPYIRKKNKIVKVTESVDEPHYILSHGTVENSNLRRYLLEDIMSASPGDQLLILGALSRPYWSLYKDVINRFPVQSKVMQGEISFWQICINCVKNAQLNKGHNKELILA